MSLDHHFDHNHDHDLDDDEGGEFEVNIDPREDELERLKIDQGDFEEALYAALDAQGETLESTEGGQVANTLEAITLTIKGKSYRLGDLAYVTIEEADDEDDEDDEEDEL
jgi:hypothetical protein